MSDTINKWVHRIPILLFRASAGDHAAIVLLGVAGVEIVGAVICGK